MSFNVEGEKSIQFRPDLAIIKNNTITHIFDLKMDMGYKRRYFESDTFIKKSEVFNIFRNNHYERVSYKIDKNNNRQLNVSENIINQVVVISEKNQGKLSNRTDMIEAIDTLDWIEIYYLTGENHPNNYSDKKPEVRDEEFNRLFEDIKRNLA